MTSRHHTCTNYFTPILRICQSSNGNYSTPIVHNGHQSASSIQFVYSAVVTATDLT
jgi:hypothetical protein